MRLKKETVTIEHSKHNGRHDNDSDDQYIGFGKIKTMTSGNNDNVKSIK